MMEYYSHIPDVEVQTLERMRPLVPIKCREIHEDLIWDRREYVWSGVHGILAAHEELQDLLQQIDRYLRFRFDFKYDCYVIERIDTGLRAWVMLFRWAWPDGKGRRLSWFDLYEIEDKLLLNDMRRFSTPKEYLNHKRTKAERIKKANWDRGVDELRDVIDAMPRKRVEEFIAAERAIASGERIHVRGQDAATLNMWHDMGRTGQVPPSIPDPSQAINSGHNPTQGVRA